MKTTKPSHSWEKNPGEFFHANGPLLLPLPGNEIAAKIIAEQDLNRAGLVEVRAEYLRKIGRLADLWAQEKTAELKEIVRDELLEALGDDQEFAFFGRALAKSLGVPSE